MGILAELHEVTGKNHTRNSARWSPENLIAPPDLILLQIGTQNRWSNTASRAKANGHSVSPSYNIFYCPLFWASIEYEEHLNCRFCYYSAFFGSFRGEMTALSVAYILAHSSLLSPLMLAVIKPILDTKIKFKQCLNIVMFIPWRWNYPRGTATARE